MTLTEYRVDVARRIVRARRMANQSYKQGNTMQGNKRNEVARRHEQCLGMLIADEVFRDWESRS